MGTGAGTVFHGLSRAGAERTFPTFTAFLPRSKGHLSQPSPADTQLSKGWIMWTGQSLLTKLFPHWETNFACLNNFRVKNVFSSLLPTLFSFKTVRTAMGTRFISEASTDHLDQDSTTFTGPYLWGKITARGDVDFLHLKRKQRCPFSRGFLLKGKSHF